MRRMARGGRFIGALVLVLAVVVGAWWWLRRPEPAIPAATKASAPPESKADPAARVVVKVVHAGRPIEGVGVLLQQKSRQGPFFTERTDRAGQARFFDVPPGDYAVVTMHLEYPSVRRELVVAAGSLAVTLALPNAVPAARSASRLDDAGVGLRHISGQVVNDTGEPIPRAQVGASGEGVPRFVSSDDEGRFELSGLAGTRVNVFATAPDYAQFQQRGVAVGSEGLRLVMSKAAEVSGSLTYARMPDELHVRLCRYEPDQHKEVCVKHEYQNPPTAHFMLKRAPVGRFDLVFSSSDRELKRLVVELRPGEHVEVPLQNL